MAPQGFETAETLSLFERTLGWMADHNIGKKQIGSIGLVGMLSGAPLAIDTLATSPAAASSDFLAVSEVNPSCSGGYTGVSLAVTNNGPTPIEFDLLSNLDAQDRVNEPPIPAGRTFHIAANAFDRGTTSIRLALEKTVNGQPVSRQDINNGQPFDIACGSPTHPDKELPPFVDSTPEDDSGTAPAAELSSVESLPKPVRIIDSRVHLGLSSALTPFKTKCVTIAGTGGLPPDPSKFTGVFINTTMISKAPAYAQGFKGPIPETSIVNTSKAGVPAAAIALIRTDNGKICFRSNQDADIIGDVLAYTAPSKQNVINNGLTPVTPQRMLDTRTNGGPFQNGETRYVHLAPAGTKAAVVNVTAIDSKSAGYFTLKPTADNGTTNETSSVNFDAPQAGQGDTVPNLAIVPLDAYGGAKVSAFGSADLALDVNAVLEPGGDQVLQGSPVRIADISMSPAQSAVRVQSRSSAAGQSAGGQQTGAILTYTIDQNKGPGYGTVKAECDPGLQTTSTGNVVRVNQTRAFMAISGVSTGGGGDDGSFCVWNLPATREVVDLNAYTYKQVTTPATTTTTTMVTTTSTTRPATTTTTSAPVTTTTTVAPTTTTTIPATTTTTANIGGA